VRHKSRGRSLLSTTALSFGAICFKLHVTLVIVIVVSTVTINGLTSTRV